jgi:AcrR family transcriptional regulator
MVAAAVDVVDRDGLSGLTMRALGRELGVEAMSLYHYVASKTELLDAVVEAINGEVRPPPERPGSWQEALKIQLTEFRRVLHRHPNAVPLFATRSVMSPQALAMIESALATLRGAGFGPVAAIDGYRVLMSFTLGFVVGEVSLLDDPSRDPSSWGTAAYALVDLPVETVPTLAELAPLALARDGDEQFADILDVILGGLERTLLGTG